MKFKCLIVDDEPIAQNILKGFIIPKLEVYKVCDNAMEALSVLNEDKIDILFLDIEMPKITGLSFLKTLSHPPATIITTAYRQFALEGFELNVVDYLLKPFSFERFLSAVNKITKKQEISNYPPAASEKDYIFFKVDKKNIKVYLEDIFYVEALSNYVIVHLENEQLVVYSSLRDIEDLLPTKEFIRIHRSYIIAFQKIKAYGRDYVEVADKQLSIGNTYKDNFFNMIN